MKSPASGELVLEVPIAEIGTDTTGSLNRWPCLVSWPKYASKA